MTLKKLRNIVFGAPHNPLSAETRKHISLIALLAWIGLGADGLSSSVYGPEQAFLALGGNIYLGFAVAIMITITVFIISWVYCQVIELFPSGGGGYKVATRLIGPYAGLVSGVALILGYVLTIALSFASGIDSLFSLLPLSAQHYKLTTEVCLIILLTYLNLRGMKESIKIFMPLFLGFVITHAIIIVYGVGINWHHFTFTFQQSAHQTHEAMHSMGTLALLIFLFRAYSLGGGTYTGLEAVANNVRNLAEPRVRTGRWTMLYMAVSLGFAAGGILFLYTLWDAHSIAGQTLNAVVFTKILQNVPFGHAILIVLLSFEAGMLFVGANTGFLGGPAVLANMAIDGWVPKRFRNLSSRLVVQNGIVLLGIMALIILVLMQGVVSQLLVIYSSSVFVTFTLAMLGVCIYWAKRRTGWFWPFHCLFSLLGFLICAAILVMIIATKFTQGGWISIVINVGIILIGLLIRNHYRLVKKQIKRLDKLFYYPLEKKHEFIPHLEPSRPTAVFFVGDSVGEGMHTLLSMRRMFPDYFRNYAFVSVGVVDVNSYESEITLHKMEKKVKQRLQYFVDYSHQLGIPATAYYDFGIDPVGKIDELSDTIIKDFPSSIFFAAKLILKNETALTRVLHNETPMSVQRHLLLRGIRMIILPVQVSLKD